MKYKLLLVMVCLIYLLPTASVFSASTDNNSNDYLNIEGILKNDKVCDIKIDSYYWPREFLKKYKNDNYEYSIGLGNLIGIMNMYSNDIDYFINKPVNSNYDFLGCAYKLNQSEEKLVIDIYFKVEMDILKDNTQPLSLKKDEIEFFDPLEKTDQKRICEQYNKIAFGFEKNNIFNRAEEIYRYVISKYPDIQGCSRVAEIALQTLRVKGAGTK